MAVGSGTTSRGYHYLLPGEAPDIAGITQQLAGDINADIVALIASLLTPGGWVTVGSASTITSTVAVNKLGSLVLVRGTVAPTTSWAANTNYSAVVTMPVGYRISTSGPSYFRLNVGNSVTATARLNMKSDGTVDLFTGATAPTSIDLGVLGPFLAETS